MLAWGSVAPADKAITKGNPQLFRLQSPEIYHPFQNFTGKEAIRRRQQKGSDYGKSLQRQSATLSVDCLEIQVFTGCSLPSCFRGTEEIAV